MRPRGNGRPVTGDGVISWAGFLILLPYSLSSMFLSNPDLTHESLGLRAVLSLASQCLLFLVLLAWRSASLRNPALSSTSPRVIMAYIAASLLRAVSLAVALDVLGVTDGVDWPRRLIASVAGFTTSLVLIDLVVESFRQHRRRIAELLARQQAAERTRDEAVVAIDAQRSEVIERIRDQLIVRVEDLGRAAPEDALQTLKSTADDIVRPLSRQLSELAPHLQTTAAASTRPSFNLRAFLSDAADGRPLSPGWIALLFLVYGGPFLIGAIAPEIAIVLLAAAFAVIWTLMTLTNAVMARLSPRSPTVVRVIILLALIALSGVMLAASSLYTVPAEPSVIWRVAVGDFTLLVTISLALVCAHAVRRQDDTIERELESAAFTLDWESARARCARWQVQRSLARAMHGPVQSALGVAAIRLERAMEAGQADQALLESLHSNLVAVFRNIRDESARVSPLVVVLAEFAETWAGVCEIHWSIAPDAAAVLDGDPIAHFATRELTREACWNSIRHGAPTIVAVTLTSGPGFLSLTVRDDGKERVTGDGTKPGLGSRMLTDMTLQWERTFDASGTTLIAQVPALI